MSFNQDQVMVFHQCCLCDERFLQSSELEDHCRIHSKPVTKEEVLTVRANDIDMGSDYKIQFEASVNLGESEHEVTEVMSNSVRDMLPYTNIIDKNPGPSFQSVELNQNSPSRIILFQCGVCKLLFTSTSVLLQHLQTHPNRDLLLHCNVCKRIFQNHLALQDHIQIHLEAMDSETTAKQANEFRNNLKCESDPETMSSNENQITHQQTHQHRLTKIVLMCPLCSEIFISVETQQKHITAHEELGECICKKCGLLCKTMFELVKHNEIKHREKAYECSVCGKSFLTPVHLNNHMKYHESRQILSCDQCNRSFTTDIGLRNHRLVHSNKQCICDVCGKYYSSMASLASHKSAHREKCFKCTNCGKMFKGSNQLSRHKRIHTGEKPFQCGVCSQSFNQKSSLVTHMRIHTGEKPYSCTGCEKAFSQLSAKRSHEVTHFKFKPFQCTMCGRGYKAKKSLINHIDKKHNNNQSNVDNNVPKI